MGDTGFEPPAPNPGEKAILGQRGAESGAQSEPIDADLQSLIEAWPKLNESTKAKIVVMVQSSLTR